MQSMHTQIMTAKRTTKKKTPFGQEFRVVYVPLILFAVAHEDIPVCDYTLQCFSTEQDAIDLYPDAPIIPIQIPVK